MAILRFLRPAGGAAALAVRRWGLLVLGTVGVLQAGCSPSYHELPAYSPERHLLQVVVETPAGATREWYYHPTAHDFRPRQQAGVQVVVPFLPYPANAGFIPGTHQPGAAGGRPQAALILAESQPTGTVLEVLPIGLLLLDNAGEMEKVVLTVPARPSLRALPGVTSWQELTARYPAAREVLHLWYQHRMARGQTRVVGWRDEHAATQQIRLALAQQ